MIKQTVIDTQVLILGGGPGGYSAAFRCSDLGKKTCLIEQYNVLGGVCLNVGCIPSKTLLNIAKMIKNIKILKKLGISDHELNININNLNHWKNNIVINLNKSLENMMKLRNIQFFNGIGEFSGSNSICIKKNSQDKNDTIIYFEDAIIATGSYANKLSMLNYKDSRVWNSTDALELRSIPNKLLIVGGGIIGMEMASIYHALGSEITILEIFDQLIVDADRDIIDIFMKTIKDDYNIMLNTKIITVSSKDDGLYVIMEELNSTKKIESKYDAMIVAIGRSPNINLLNLDKIGIDINENNFIKVNSQMQTNIPNIYAIGDVIGEPMLAHKSIYQGHMVSEIICKTKQRYFDPKVIPYVTYTYPEIAWIGLTEKIAIRKNISYETSLFPWKASGKAILSHSSEGVTKLIFEKNTHRILGGAVVGNSASELLGEIGIAIEMGCFSEDIALTIHAHPTLYETINQASLLYEGSITDIINPKKI